MPYTFGGSAGDDITFPTALGNNGATVFCCGWFLPTTLTAGRYLFADTPSAKIGTTTSELVLEMIGTTTGKWDTSGVGLTVGQWSFLAFLMSRGSGTDVADWRVWSGTVDSPPVACSVSVNTAWVGAGNPSSLTIGNLSSSDSLAFEGDIAEFASCMSANNASRAFGISTAGSITQAAEDYVFSRFVIPLWQGRGLRFNGNAFHDATSGTNAEQFLWQRLNGGSPSLRLRCNTTSGVYEWTAPTMNAAQSLNGAPRPLLVPTPEIAFRPRR